VNPEAALRKTGGFARGARVVRRLHESPVKSVWLVERRGERFVLRVDQALACDLGLDRGAELRVLRDAYRAGFAPEPVLLVPGGTGYPGDTGPAILVTRYAAGRAWSAALLREPARLRRLAFLLRDLHAADLDGPPLDLDAALTCYAALAGTTAARALALRAHRLIRKLGRAHSTLCHNDPIAANVVGSRQAVLIDWEYAGRGDPVFDLAVIIRHHRLGVRASNMFAAAYFGGAGRIPRERLMLNCALYDLVLKLWLMATTTN